MREKGLQGHCQPHTVSARRRSSAHYVYVVQTSLSHWKSFEREARTENASETLTRDSDTFASQPRRKQWELGPRFAPGQLGGPASRDLLFVISLSDMQ